MFETANYIEACLWVVVGVICGAYAGKRQGAVRRLCLIAAVAFVLFGVSDVVEVRTGAWWRPWWLFVWKCVCVVTLVTLLCVYVRMSRQRT